MIENYSRPGGHSGMGFRTLKVSQFEFVHGANIGGDAPKDFIRIFEYGKANKHSKANWPHYIAKIGNKHYPNESITEYLITRIGQVWDLPIADASLFICGRYLRYASKYFLKPLKEQLIHGAEIFGGYVNDQAKVEQIELDNLARREFTFAFAQEALRNRFPGKAEEIVKRFIEMLTFDALVGNNDRHFYNWGVIVETSGEEKPRFSPIFDTARGLFWNQSDAAIREKYSRSSADRAAFMNKYVTGSRPKIGWEGEGNHLNHFDLLRQMAIQVPYAQALLQEKTKAEYLAAVERLLQNEFARWMIPERISLILQCLETRFSFLRKFVI